MERDFSKEFAPPFVGAGSQKSIGKDGRLEIQVKVAIAALSPDSAEEQAGT